MITISNKQVRINGRKIILADSSEGRLLYMDTRELDLLAEIGVNAISATIFGGDVKSITPFIGNKPENGYDFQKWDKWHYYFKYANSLGIVVFVITSEKENHFALNTDKEKDLVKTFVANFSDLSIIFTKEEYPTGQNARLRDVYTMLKSEINTQGANHLIALHNNTDQVNYTGNNDLINLIQLQTKLATGNASIKKAYDAGFAVFQSEIVGGVNENNLKNWCNLGAGMSSGAGAYFADGYDLKAPRYNDGELYYEPIYSAMVRELGGTVTETVTTSEITDSNLILNGTFKLPMT